MPVDLGPLAFDARATPLPNILVDGGPDDLAADEVLVVGIEESPTEGRRDVWAGVAEGDVTEKVIAGVRDSDSLKVKEGLLNERSRGRVLPLLSADQMIIHCIVGEGRCGYVNPRQSIGGRGVRAPIVSDVRREL